jgi:hypothetical protein
MRKISTVLVVLVMMAMCTSSFGYFLIFNVSTTVKGADYDTDLATTIAMKGYLLLNIADGCDTLVDANLVLYGKDTSKQKVYVRLNYTSDEFLDIDIWTIGDFVFFGLDTEGPYFDFECMLSGKGKMLDIGYGTSDKKYVANSIKGVGMVWDGYLLGPSSDQDVSATGNVSATLNNPYTKAVNDTDPTWTQDQIIHGQMIGGTLRGIIPDLEAKGYEDATP